MILLFLGSIQVWINISLSVRICSREMEMFFLHADLNKTGRDKFKRWWGRQCWWCGCWWDDY